MLMLSRKVGQRIYINDNIVVVVREINGRSVRLGIDAPADVPIHREEIWLKKKLEDHDNDNRGDHAGPAKAL